MKRILAPSNVAALIFIVLLSTVIDGIRRSERSAQRVTEAKEYVAHLQKSTIDDILAECGISLPYTLQNTKVIFEYPLDNIVHAVTVNDSTIVVRFSVGGRGYSKNAFPEEIGIDNDDVDFVDFMSVCMNCQVIDYAIANRLGFKFNVYEGDAKVCEWNISYAALCAHYFKRWSGSDDCIYNCYGPNTKGYSPHFNKIRYYVESLDKERTIKTGKKPAKTR